MDFGYDLEKIETEIDSLPFIKEMLSQPTLRVFLSDSSPATIYSHNFNLNDLFHGEILFNRNIREDTEDQKLALISELRLAAGTVGMIWRDVALQPISSSHTNRISRSWKKTLDFIIDTMVSCNYLKQTESKGEGDHKDTDAVVNSVDDITRIGEKADSSNCLTSKEKNRAFLLITAFPTLRELKEPCKILEFFLELSKELNNLPALICDACEGQPLFILLTGSLLSFKPRAYNTWNEVKDDLVKVIVSTKDATNNNMWDFFNYCYHDLPNFLKPCFLYLACYPIYYEIPARSLTEMWIAEEFLTPDNGETIEETARRCLDQLVQRSLVYVSKRSLLGTIKCCRVRQSLHKFAIKKSCKVGFLDANPDEDKMKSVHRLAIHLDNKKQYTLGVNINHIGSFLAFDFDRNVSGFALNLKVLELRRSAISEIALQSTTYLCYLGLRGSKNISKLPENIGDMKHLQTLDVRDTKIKILPESLWNISTLRNVYVNPSPQMKGPPSKAYIPDLQILKTVAVPESWLEKSPQFLINLRKLALSNRDNPDGKSNPYWKSISIMLSRMVNLHSITIIGDLVPSEFVDTRAFPNLETVRTIKFKGKWNCRKLFIDNVKFPPNLIKLTLTNSGLKEDPMPTLGRLQALKYLSLQDGAYTGNKMICSANGFPQLQFLKLKKLGNLESLEVKPMAMSQLATVRVVQCPKLQKPPNLQIIETDGYVTAEDIDI